MHVMQVGDPMIKQKWRAFALGPHVWATPLTQESSQDPAGQVPRRLLDAATTPRTPVDARGTPGPPCPLVCKVVFLSRSDAESCASCGCSPPAFLMESRANGGNQKPGSAHYYVSPSPRVPPGILPFPNLVWVSVTILLGAQSVRHPPHPPDVFHVSQSNF